MDESPFEKNGFAVREHVARELALGPWQREVLDAILATDPKTGRPVYDRVQLTIPHRSGVTAFYDRVQREIEPE